MADSASKHPAADSLAFFGEITASVTHELNNVIGTIEQVVGVVDDMVALDQALSAEVRDRLGSVVERVEKQSLRGTALIRRLNRFAHLNDVFVTDCALGELLENICALAERKAGLKRVKLATRGFVNEVVVHNSPLLIAQAVYGCIKVALEAANPDEPLEIDLKAESVPPQVAVRFAAEADGELSLDVLQGDLPPGLQVETATDGDRVAIVLTLGERDKDAE